MTDYTITPGYSGGDRDISWEVLLEAVKAITQEELLNEYQGPETCEDGCCSCVDMAKHMTVEQGVDLSVRIDEEARQVRMLASGGGVNRDMKEHMRRAFTLCVMRRADKQSVDVDVSSG